MKFVQMAVLLPLALAACAQSQPISGQPAPIDAALKTDPTISEADLKERLYAVAHDSMIGRATGTIGHIKVTEHIAAEMKRLGLQPGGENGSYFQNVPFVKRVLKESTLTVDGAALEVWKEYLPLHPGAPARSFDGAQVIYGGVIQDTLKQISREQAAGKFVVLLNRGGGLSAASTTPNSRWHDAVAIAVVNNDRNVANVVDFVRNAAPTYTGNPLEGTRGHRFILNSAGGARLVGAAVDTALQPGTVGKTVRGSIAYSEEPLTARNVIAILPGSDARLRNTYVAIGSHSDHDPIDAVAVDHDSLRVFNALVRAKTIELGRNPNPAERTAIKVNVDSLRALRPARRDSINNGADDDGSGTVAMLEIAEAMAASRDKPKRSMLFVWHVAEELGLIGANYYTEHPTVPRDSIVAALNIDMIGRGGAGEERNGGPDYLQLIGWRRLSNQLGDVIDAVNKQQPLPFKFDLQYDAPGHPEQFYCRSDHYMYARFGIPVAFFSTGGHGDYHQVTDEPQYIDYTKLRNVTQLIHDVGKTVANLAERPVVDGPRPDPKGQCRQ
jgi:hypothetical protein